MIHPPRPHDLLHVRVEPALFRFEHDTEQAFAHLRRCPLVVVRRGVVRNGCIPIGVRGPARSDRYAGWMKPEAIQHIDAPASLLHTNHHTNMPALKALDELNRRWLELKMPWGPTGSVGFELASGIATATAWSDLDIQIRADRPIRITEAERLLAATAGLPAAVDILVETLLGGFALAEYAQTGTCMLRTDQGPMLTQHPWRKEAA